MGFIRLPATMDSLEQLSVFLRRECEEHDVEADDLKALELISDELASNICRYAYEDGAGDFELTVRFGAGLCCLRFIDQGTPFDPTQREAPDTEASIHDRGIGGLGIFFVRNEATRFDYERRGNDNVVTVCRRLARSATEAPGDDS